MRWIATGALLALAGCATGTYTPPTGQIEAGQQERTVPKSYDEAWATLVEYASGNFFAIDKFEKASGLMTLSFGTREPSRYIDCGHMKAQNASASIDLPYVQFMEQQRGARLDGRMNIFLKSLESKKTLVKVTARYVFSAPAAEEQPAVMWSFDSGSESTINVGTPVPGTIPTRTCRPTYAAERAVLDAVGK